MASRQFEQFQGSLEKGVVKLYATITTSTSGTIASSVVKGLAVSKVAAKAGRYAIALQDSYMRLLAVNAVVIGAADAAYTTANGVQAILRNVAVASATAPAFEIQLCRTDTGADAEVIDAAVILVEITLSNSSV